MVKLWVPSGNKDQTEIDILVSEIDNFLAKAQLDLSLVKQDLSHIDYNLDEYNVCLRHLKTDGLIVSISEYDLIKKQQIQLNWQKKKCLHAIDLIKDSVKTKLEQKSKYLELRKKLETKIIEGPWKCR